jgi:DNA replication protein DnaC
MLTHPTLDKLHQLRLSGMARAYQQHLTLPDIDLLSVEERLGLMVDCEVTERASRRLTTRLRQAQLRHSATIEDIDYRHPRSLDKSLMTKLATCHWVREHHNLLITGPTGIGKSWLACALAHQACRDGLNVQYVRVARFFTELVTAKGDGRYAKQVSALARTDLLVLDDFGTAALKDEHRRDLLEILDDRYGVRSTLVTSQFPIENWHELIGDPTLADAILDRLIHNAYKIHLEGESMRKNRKMLTQTGHSDT